MPTPDINPSDAIIPVGVNNSVVDPVMFIMASLRNEWNPENTDGIVPTIDFAEVTKNVAFRLGSDYVLIYTTNVVTEPVTITYGWQNEEHHFVLDFFTGGDRPHLAKFIEEARRIIHSHRTDTFGSAGGELTGRHWIQWGLSMTSFDKNDKNMYRRRIECILNVRFRQIR